MTLHTGSFIPQDQIHEQWFNLPLKSAILRNRQNPALLENIGQWLPKRGKLKHNFDEFVFPHSAWRQIGDEDGLRQDSEPQKARKKEKLVKIIKHVEEKVNMTYDSILNEEASTKLESFDKKNLDTKDEQRFLGLFGIEGA